MNVNSSELNLTDISVVNFIFIFSISSRSEKGTYFVLFSAV